MLQDKKIKSIVYIMINYTDAHCHIISAPCPDTLVGRICDATQQPEWDKIQTILDDRTFACIGVHPWHIKTVTQNWDSELRDMLIQNPRLMVGEIGMDKYHDNMTAQEQIFITQLKIAAQLRRPVHVHCVGAFDKILHIFKELNNSLPPLVVIHAFNGDTDIIQQLADKYNVYFSYGAPQDAKAESRILNTPQERLLVESDAFDNDTAIQKIEETTNTLATIFGQEPNEFSEQIYQNFQRVISYVRPID